MERFRKSRNQRILDRANDSALTSWHTLARDAQHLIFVWCASSPRERVPETGASPRPGRSVADDLVPPQRDQVLLGIQVPKLTSQDRRIVRAQREAHQAARVAQDRLLTSGGTWAMYWLARTRLSRYLRASDRILMKLVVAKFWNSSIYRKKSRRCPWAGTPGSSPPAAGA